MSPALIFDRDGVVIGPDTDRHRRAVNQVWRELGIDWQWSETAYGPALSVSDGTERLARLRDDVGFRAVFDVPDDPEEWREIVARWHRRKTEIYLGMITRHGVVARPGVGRLAQEALRAGWRVGLATAGSRAAAHSVVRAALGPELSRRMTIVSGDEVPDVLIETAAAMGIDPADAIVIEHDRNGLLAAVAAGMTCVITPTQHTFHADFAEADLVISGLGEPAGRPEIVLGGRCWARARPYLGLDDLAELLTAGRSAGAVARH